MASSIILKGYKSGKEMYHLILGDNNLKEEWLADEKAGTWTSARPIPLSPQLAAINRLAFFPPGKNDPFWLLPVRFTDTDPITAPFSMKLAVTNAGTAAAVFSFAGFVGGWLQDSGRKSNLIQLQFQISLSNWQPVFTQFGFHDIGGAQTVHADYSADGLKGLAGVRSLVPQGRDSAFITPDAGRAIGMASIDPQRDFNNDADEEAYFLAYSWAFDESDLKDAPKQALLRLNKQVYAKGTATLRGSDVSLPYTSLTPFGTADAPGNEGVKYCWEFELRQPDAYLLADFLAASKFAWRFSISLPYSCVAAQFNGTVVDPVVNSLGVIQAGNPLTLMPQFDEDDDKGDPWLAQYVLLGTLSGKFDSVNPMRVAPIDGAAPVRFSLPGIQTANGGGLAFTAQPQSVPGISDLNGGDANVWSFQLLHQLPTVPGTSDSPSPQLVKMGALDLVFMPEALPSTSPVDLKLFFPSQPIRIELDGKGKVTARRVQFTLQMTALSPGGQDSVPGDDQVDVLGATESESHYSGQFVRSKPLVFQRNPSSRVWQPSFLLDFHEQIVAGKNQSMLLTLKVAPGGAGGDNLEAYVLDAEPFFVGRVRSDSLGKQISDAASTEIGHWSNREGVDGWQLLTTAQGFQLDLPPQGVGEAMHKRSGEGDILPGVAADFRFTPPANLQLQASYFQQQFADAPWNLRRILGYPGQRAPGAQMDFAQFEVLYGANVTIGKPNARLAEIGSQIGAMPGSQPELLPWPATEGQNTQYCEERGNWGDLQPVLRSRLAALEPWRYTIGDAPTFDDANEVSIELRSNDQLRAPVPGLDPKLAMEFREAGLPGGWAWGFESLNILNAVLVDRKSVTAELHNLVFSSLGAWAHQKASFDRGLSTIYCQMSMGRVESVTIERIGRIEPLWNRAKHIIVYKRSVAASRQFYLQQDAFFGNPVLRKTDEYVELIEQERPFPDFNHDKQNRGFVVGSRFEGKPPRIPVDSRWGNDVGTTGWQVPLWRRDAAPSDVYGRPDIGLLFANADSETVKHSIANPEILRFYTNTDIKAGNDPDYWPAVEGVSFDRFDGAGLTTPTPDAIAPGLGGFTFQLDPAPAASNVVVDRSASNAISARINNVVVMRGYVAGKSAQPDGLKTAQSLRESVASAFTPVTAAPQTSVVPIAVGDISKALQALSTAVAGNQVQEAADAVAGDLQRRIVSQFDLFSDSIVSSVQTAFSSLGSQLISLVKAFATDDTWSDYSSDDPAFPKEQRLTVAGQRDRLLDALDDLWSGENGALEQLYAMRGLPGEAQQTLERSQSSIDDAQSTVWWAIELAIATLQNFPDVVPIPSSVDAEQAGLIATACDVTEEQLKTIEFLLGAPLQPWIGAQLDTLRINLAKEQPGLRSLREDLSQIRTSVAQNLTPLDNYLTLLTQLRGDVDTFIARAQTELNNGLQTPLANLTGDPDFFGPITQLWDGTDLPFNLDGLRSLLADAIAQANDWDSLVQLLQAALLQFFHQLAGAIGQLMAQLRNALTTYAEKIFQQLGAVLVPMLDDLRQYLRDEVEAATDLIDGLAKDLPLDALRDELQRLESGLATVFDGLVTRLKLYLPVDAGNLPSVSADNVFRLLRAFGEPPSLHGLDFDLSQCSFQFFDFSQLSMPWLPHVDLSPLLASASDLLHSGQLLNPIQIDLPINGLLDHLLPVDLTQLDLNGVFSNWGGMEMRNLFPLLKLPEIANNNVRITHGEELSTRSAWLQIDADVPFSDQPIDVFTMAGIHLRLLNARFEGTCRMAATLGSTPTQNVSGSITGDWDLSVGGFPIVVLERCGLIYQQGQKLQFDVSVDRVKLQAVLSFLADLMASLGLDDSGFTFALTPTSASTTLSLPLPDIQAGAFGIANLNLGFFFGLSFAPEFTITTGLRVGRRTAPFTLTIFILGGAGYFETDVSYTPGRKAFLVTVSVGIFASAGLAVSLGPISGGIYAYFGIAVDFTAGTGQSSSLNITLVILFTGQVTLLGFLSVGLSLSLEASYRSGGQLTGTGTVSYSIKIGWFIDIHVSAAVQYSFGSSPSSDHKALNPPAANEPSVAEVARRHEAMFV